jgi:MFS family permease
VLATVGLEVQAVAVGWELYQRTESPLALGLTGLAQFLPVLLLALPAGQVADHFSRKAVLQVAQGVMALTFLGLAALSYWQGPVALVFVCLVLSGCCRAFTMPARTSLLPQVVPIEVLANAVTWNSSGFQLANVAGPALGGLVIALTGQAVAAYLLAAACAVGCVLVLIPVRPRVPARQPLSRSLESLLAGVRFVWHSELLLAAITLDLFAVLLGGAVALLPVYARDILGVGAEGLGWLRAAPAVGALLMAALLAHRPPMRRAGPTLLVAVAGFGAATVVFGLSRHVTLSFAMLLLIGALDNISVVVRGTLMQVLTPDDMRGRVAAVNSVFISSSNELGAFESGLTAHLFGPVISVVAGGIGTILVVVAVMLRWPNLLGLRELQAPKS